MAESPTRCTYLVICWFVLGITPPNLNGSTAKGGLMRRENVLGSLQSSERCNEMVVTRGCVNRIRIWPLKRDERSGVLIGAGGTYRSDWPERVRGAIDSPRAGKSGLSY